MSRGIEGLAPFTILSCDNMQDNGGAARTAIVSLPTPTSKPDLAIAAGCPTVGNVRFVPEAEREERRAGLETAGVAAVINSWEELAEWLRWRPERSPTSGGIDRRHS